MCRGAGHAAMHTHAHAHMHAHAQSHAGSQPVGTVVAACWYVAVKLHRALIGGLHSRLGSAFGEGLQALSDGVYSALAAIPEHELLPHVLYRAAVHEY